MMTRARAAEGGLAATVGVGLVFWAGTTLAGECKLPKVVVSVGYEFR